MERSTEESRIKQRGAITMPKHVLIVDDESLIASSLKAFLEDEGMVAVAAASGEEAIEMLRADPDYDVCVMDMRLPGMDGDMAIRSIHALYPRFALFCTRVPSIISCHPH